MLPDVLKTMKTAIKYVLVALGSVVFMLGLLISFLLVAYLFTLAQWMVNGYDFRKPKTRGELERHIIFKVAHKYNSYTNLEYGQWYSFQQKYRASPGDTFYCYKVLGIMPIDAVYDSNDNVKIVFQTFDY
jgi:hypothetical protein